jgi:polysaccharide biosynthesis transport protein
VTPPLPPALRPDYQLAGPAGEDAAPASAFPIQRLLACLIKYWWLPVCTLLLGLGAALGFVLCESPTFVTKGRMWETVKMQLPEGAMFSEDAQNFLGTQTELLQSETLRNLALARLRMASNGIPIPNGKDGEPLPVLVRVTPASKSSVFLIQATSSQAAYTQAYLEALMEVYLEYKRDIRQQVSGGTLASITEQVQSTERDLKAEQDALMAFQRSNNLAVLEQEGANAGGYLATLRTRLADLQLDARLIQAGSTEKNTNAITGTNTVIDTNATTGTDTNTDLEWADAMAGTEKASVSGAPMERQEASKELEMLKMQRDKLSTYLRPKHPKIVKLDDDIARAEKVLEISRRQGQEQLAASHRALQVKLDNVLASIKEAEGRVSEANARIAEAERLKLNVQRFQSVYDRLMLMVQNVGISRNIDQETLQVLEHATPATRSYTRETGQLALGGVGGLGLGLAIILLMTVRDDRFSSLTEVNQKLGEFVVGQVPEVSGLKPDSALPLLELNDKRHAYAESFRSLRSALMFMPVENERPRVVLVTSALPHEGKSTVAANLARALALGGSRVVLVDGDLRKGVLHELMGLPREPGLSELLQQPADFGKIIQTNCLANLSFISSGRPAAGSGDLLLGAAFDQLLAGLRGQFDYVVIDSSPVFAADDAMTLAPKVDGTLFVVRSRFSRAGPVREALDQLYQRNARVLGVIFNQADTSARSYYYHKYPDYYAPVAGSP